MPWVWHVPKSWFRFFLWLLSLPLIAIMFITVPDCRQKRWKSWFLLTFAMSIVWIGLYSYIMVWMITIVGWLLSLLLCLCAPACFSLYLSICLFVCLNLSLFVSDVLD